MYNVDPFSSTSQCSFLSLLSLLYLLVVVAALFTNMVDLTFVSTMIPHV